MTLPRQDLQPGNHNKSLVIIPANFKVPEHKHPSVDTFVTPVFGHVKVTRGDEVKIISSDDYPYHKTHIVPHGIRHSVETFKECFVYLLEEIWHGVGGSDNKIEDDWIGEPLTNAK